MTSHLVFFFDTNVRLKQLKQSLMLVRLAQHSWKIFHSISNLCETFFFSFSQTFFWSKAEREALSSYQDFIG